MRRRRALKTALVQCMRLHPSFGLAQMTPLMVPPFLFHLFNACVSIVPRLREATPYTALRRTLHYTALQTVLCTRYEVVCGIRDGWSTIDGCHFGEKREEMKKIGRIQEYPLAGLGSADAINGSASNLVSFQSWSKLAPRETGMYLC